MGKKKLLVLTSSGGGGLLQAAAAKEEQLRLEDPDLIVIRCDVLKEWIGKLLGWFCIQWWNAAQRMGSVKMQRLIFNLQSIFDWFVWLPIFFHALRILFKEDVDRIIDTQPMGTFAILRAIRIFNRRRGKEVYLEKVLVDLPTKKATHFFLPIKRLSAEDRRYLKLTTIAPLLDEGETAEKFWQEACGLSEKEVCYEDVYVRQPFRRLQREVRSEGAFEIAIRYNNCEELALMRKSFEKGPIQSSLLQGEVRFRIASKERLATLLLGSQPARDATLAYVERFLCLAQKWAVATAPVHLFVFCSNHKPGRKTLFREVVDLVTKFESYPKGFSVVPFSFQPGEGIASLFFRSDLTCTRSGGQTAMELMSVASGQVWIHSEAKKKKGELSLQELLDGIPNWESASALYLQKAKGAKLVTPETFAPLAPSFFRGCTHSINL